jgi:GTP-binding protein
MYEPFELVEIDVPLDYQGVVLQELGKRSAEILQINPNESGTEIHFEAKMATRALIGLKSYLLTSTKGTVVINSVFDEYKPTIHLNVTKDHGSLISMETGTTMAYSLNNAQERGTLFVGAAVDVYAGMVIGETSKNEDLELNPTKGKQLSNVRSKSSDDALTLTPPREMGLENALEYIGDDELVEVTPLNIRIRKKYLDPNDRKRNKAR